jgi:predicted DNA-binding transcriptional regulator YafY
MGRQSGSKTAIGLVAAFIKKPVWAQADLARQLGIGVPALRRRLAELQDAGVKLETEEDHPHVYWSVPKKWLPNAVQLEPADVVTLTRLLTRMPASPTRNRLLSRVLAATAHTSSRVGTSEAPPPVMVPSLDPREEQWLPLVEDAAQSRRPLNVSYLSTGERGFERRAISPQRVLVGPPARVLAVCHRNDGLKWFRVDRMIQAELGAGADFRARPRDEVDRAIRTSVNGFRTAADATLVSFRVRNPDARWVRGNLPPPLEADDLDDGIRVRGTTSAVIQVARFVIGLGGAATAETSELRAAVRELAEASLGANAARSEAPEPEQMRSGSDREEAGVRLITTQDAKNGQTSKGTDSHPDC